MKKFINTILIIAFILIVPFNIYANQKSDNQSIILIADEIINKEISYSQNSTAITYKNIESFINYIKENIENISEIEYDGLSEEIILETLNYKEITVSTNYIRVSNDGTLSYISKSNAERAIKNEYLYEISPNATWNSDNGYMKITTTGSLTKTTASEAYYTVATKATWLKIPICSYEDVLTIGHTGIYDSSAAKEGYLEETCKCCKLSKSYKYTTANSKYVKFDYSSGITSAAIRFKLLPASYTCDMSLTDYTRSLTSINAYLKYGIIVDRNKSFNIQGAYCHKQVSLGSIGFSVSSKGVPSFSISIVGSIKPYCAEPITIKAP